MKTKLIYGSIAAGVALFFLGWMVYGMLLADFMTAHTNQCANLPMEDMKWWPIMLSNLLSGLLLALILDWASANSATEGLKKGAIFGFLIALAYNLSFYSMTTYFLSMKGILVDVAANTFMLGIGGLIIGFIYSKQKS